MPNKKIGKQKMVPRTFTISQEASEKLQALADADEVPLSVLVRFAIRDWLAKQEAV